MLSRSKIKFIRSLHQKKYRDEYKLFIAEGPKVVNELLNSKYKVKEILATTEFQVSSFKFQVNEVSKKELSEISALTTPNQVVAVFNTPSISSKGGVNSLPFGEDLGGALVLALDDIRDPGNLGTIIRIADWFGINNILCSETCVDVDNPKVVQASMGSIARVNLYYVNLITVLKKFNTVYATVLNGTNIYTEKLSDTGIILIGNESRGISKNLMWRLGAIAHKISIPNFSGKTDSLNAAMATAIICSEFKRRKLVK